MSFLFVKTSLSISVFIEMVNDKRMYNECYSQLLAVFQATMRITKILFYRPFLSSMVYLQCRSARKKIYGHLI